MKNTLILTLVLTLLGLSIAPALAQTSEFTVNPDRMEFKATDVTGGTEPVGGESEDIGAPTTGDSSDSTSDNIDSSGEDGVRVENIGSSGEDGVLSAPVGGDSEDIGTPSADQEAGIEHEDIGGAIRQNNESDYDFVLRAISTETTAQAIFIKLGDIKGESTDAGDTDDDNDGVLDSVDPNSVAKKPREIVVVGSNVRGWDPKTKEAVIGAAPATPADVETSDDLSFFAAKLVADAGDVVPIESVTLNFEKITWEYKQQGKLLGFISLSVPTTLEVADDPDTIGRVKVRLPWYARFIGKTLSISELEQLWDDQLADIGDDAQLANIDLQNALQKQAQTLQTMSNVSKMLHDTAMAIIRKIG